jgi:hypothetical protein
MGGGASSGAHALRSSTVRFGRTAGSGAKENPSQIGNSAGRLLPFPASRRAARLRASRRGRESHGGASSSFGGAAAGGSAGRIGLSSAGADGGNASRDGGGAAGGAGGGGSVASQAGGGFEPQASGPSRSRMKSATFSTRSSQSIPYSIDSSQRTVASAPRRDDLWRRLRAHACGGGQSGSGEEQGGGAPEASVV